MKVPLANQTFTIGANDNAVYPSTPGTVANPGCSDGKPGQAAGGFFFALGLPNPGAGNPGLTGFPTTNGSPSTAQTDPLNVSYSLSNTSTGQGGAPSSTTTLNRQNPYSCPNGCPLTPTIAWTPGSLLQGVPLDTTQLNAAASSTLLSGMTASGNSGLPVTAPVPGTFTYSPGPGTVLPPGPQMLSVTFTPTNLGTKYTNYTAATASVPVVVGTVSVTSTATLSKVTGGYQMVVIVSNSGNVTASNVQLTGATLGATSGGTLPASLGDIPSGGSASVTLTFPSSTGADGAGVREMLSGTYTGGNFGGSFRAVLP